MTWARFREGTARSVRETWARWTVLIGGFALLLTVFHLPADLATLRQSTALHERGRVTSAVVVAVEEQHHSGARGGRWTEYWPVTRQTVGGDTFTASLRGYSTSTSDAYRRGQRLSVLYDPDHHRTVALADVRYRVWLERQVRKESVLGGVGLVHVAVGLPFDLRRGRRRRRRTRTPEPLGTALRRTPR
jgi:hypothetical protein